jgi:murein L,D-transpeptidase YafK
MRLVSLNPIILTGLLLLQAIGVSAADKATLTKRADLNGTEYCSNEVKLKKLSPLLHLDERNQIDRIVISKKDKKLYLLSQGRLYKTYQTAFGFGFEQGNKSKMADGRTPEGLYKVELKNDKSAYSKALRVSYPNERDKAFAKAKGVNPGGDIMIHGFPNKDEKELTRAQIIEAHPAINWTQGCIAVTNQEIEEIFSLVAVNTTIEICPAD